MTLSSRDQATIWHPLTQHQTALPPLPIVRGTGSYLIDQTGNQYIDLISSWWVNIHGHAHPEIAHAIYEQACTLEHVIFSSVTHEPAILLAEKLLSLLPKNFCKVFYSDNGSTAVEVAIKMAYQYWRNQGKKHRKRFIAFKNAYHGDTFGAMSLGKGIGWFHHFEELFFNVDRLPYPTTWIEDKNSLEKEEQALKELATHLEKFGNETAALIIEPLVQGSGGMQMCRPQFLQQLEQLVKSYDILIIYDEVMTGFGRTGDLFACLKAKTVPDIICLSKGLTGGFLPLAVTACQEYIYQAFLDENFFAALVHSHSFTANPLGCAAALASLDILQRPTTNVQIKLIEQIHQEELQKIANHILIEKTRYCGTIAAFDLMLAAEYGSNISIKLRDVFLKQGLLIRPLGNVVYIMPPYCISKNDLQHAYKIIREIIKELSHERSTAPM